MIIIDQEFHFSAKIGILEVLSDFEFEIFNFQTVSKALRIGFNFRIISVYLGDG